MQQELPILGSVNPGNDLISVIDEYNAGYIFSNGKDDLLHDHAIKLLNNAELRKRIGTNGRKLLKEKFSVEAAATHITHVLEKQPREPEPTAIFLES